MVKLNQYRDPLLLTNTSVSANQITTIGFYEREFYPFSNLSSFQVEWRGGLWATSEHAYHSERFRGVEPELVEAVRGMRSAHDAFAFAQSNKHRQLPEWDEIKRDTMKHICRAKLGQHAYIQHKLLQTDGFRLAEDSPVDSYWGIGPDGRGENNLGTIWMELREELKNGKIKQL